MEIGPTLYGASFVQLSRYPLRLTAAELARDRICVTLLESLEPLLVSKDTVSNSALYHYICGH